MSKNYKLTPVFFTTLQKKFYFVTVPLVLLMLLGGFFLATMHSGINIGVMLIIPILLIVMLFNLRKSLNQQKQSWASYQLSLESDLISLSRNQLEAVTISKDEISSIKEYSGTSIVVQAENKQIVIPVTLESFSEVRLFLSKWRNIDFAKSKSSQNILVMYSVTILTLLAFGIVAFASNKALVLITGSILLIVLISNLFLSQRNNNLDNKIKRNAWWVIIPALVIAIKLYYLIFE